MVGPGKAGRRLSLCRTRHPTGQRRATAYIQPAALSRPVPSTHARTLGLQTTPRPNATKPTYPSRSVSPVTRARAFLPGSATYPTEPPARPQSLRFQEPPFFLPGDDDGARSSDAAGRPRLLRVAPRAGRAPRRYHTHRTRTRRPLGPWGYGRTQPARCPGPPGCMPGHATATQRKRQPRGGRRLPAGSGNTCRFSPRNLLSVQVGFSFRQRRRTPTAQHGILPACISVHETDGEPTAYVQKRSDFVLLQRNLTRHESCPIHVKTILPPFPITIYFKFSRYIYFIMHVKNYIFKKAKINYNAGPAGALLVDAVASLAQLLPPQSTSMTAYPSK
jgi:hypothetical protein